MKMTKKALSIVLALAMIVNIFAVASFALSPDSACDLYISADKETYAPGEEIVLTVSEQVIPEVGNMQIAGTYVLAFNSSAIQRYSTAVDNLEAHGFTALQPGYDASISCLYDMTGVPIDSSNDWDSTVAFTVCSDGVTDFDASSEKTDLFTVKLKVADNAPDGTYVIGFNTAAYADDQCVGYSVDTANGGMYGMSAAYSAANNYSFGTCTIKVGIPDAPSILEYSKAQIRFKGIGASSPAADYQGSFDVRTVAKISQADFLATFTSEDAAKDPTTGITEFGFVYAAKSNVTDADFNIDTAKAVAKGEATDANYVKKTVTYMQHTADGADYTFTCLIKDIADEDKTDGVNCIAFVKYGEAGEYIFFDAAASVNYTALYDQYMPKA